MQLENSQSFYASEPFRISHFTIRHPVFFPLFLYFAYYLDFFFRNYRIRTENENPDQELHEIQESIEQELAANVNNQSVIKRAFVTPTVRRALVLGKFFKMVKAGSK